MVNCYAISIGLWRRPGFGYGKKRFYRGSQSKEIAEDVGGKLQQCQPRRKYFEEGGQMLINRAKSPKGEYLVGMPDLFAFFPLILNSPASQPFAQEPFRRALHMSKKLKYVKILTKEGI
jgi:hypothetical protein